MDPRPSDLSAIARELPESVRSLVQRKIDALEDTDRRLLAAASVQGMDFDSAIVAARRSIDEEEIENRLERLEREHALVRFVGELEAPDRSLTLRYRFAHHMYHNAFFDSLRATRKAALGARGRRAARRSATASGRDCAADIAVLFEVARDGVRAAEYWNLAAQAAARLYAHDETARLARARSGAARGRAAEPRARRPPSSRCSMTYALSIKTSRGYAVAEVGRAYARARELCRQVDDPSRVIPVLIGMSAHHIVSGEIAIARDVALEMLELFDRLGDPHLQMIGQWSLGAALFHLGELEVGARAPRKALTLYDPAFHGPRVWETGIEPGIFCRCELSRTMTLRGFPDTGLASVREAVAAARRARAPAAAGVRAALRDVRAPRAARARARCQRAYEQLAVVCHAHGIAQEMQWGAPLAAARSSSWATSNRGLRVIEEGLAAHTSTRSRAHPSLLSGAACRRAAARRPTRPRAGVARRRDARRRRHRPARVRLRARAAAGRGLPARRGAAARGRAQVSRGTRRSRDGRVRGGSSCAPRAATRHHLIEQGRPTEARDLLQPILAWFTEGRDTMDYLYAEGLLRTLD